MTFFQAGKTLKGDTESETGQDKVGNIYSYPEKSCNSFIGLHPFVLVLFI